MDRKAAVWSRRRGHVLKPDLGERVDDPLRGLLALLGRVLLGIGDGTERNQLGEVGLRLAHQAGDRLAPSSVTDGVVVLEVLELVTEVLDLFGAVRRDDRELA